MEPKSLRIMTYNVCFPIGLEYKPEQFAWTKRFPRIETVILSESPDVICLQEVRGQALTDLTRFFTSHEYDVQTFRSSPSKQAFVAMIAYKIKKLAFDSFEKWWASDMPDKCSDSWGNGFPRVTLMAKFYAVVKRGMKFFPNDKTDPIYVVSVHNGMNNNEKVNSNMNTVQKVESLVEKGHVFICGDFNTFDNAEGKDEIKIFTNAKYSDLSKELVTNEGIPVSGTFVGYSYDRYHRIPGKFGSQLDHIFYRHFPNLKPCKSTCHVNARQYNGKDVENPTEERHYLKDPDEMPSDHLPIIVDALIV